MGRFGIVLAATLGVSCLAHAADLPSKKTVEAPGASPNCFGSFWNWLNASADECPLSYAGMTLYSSIDVGGDYMTHGAPFNPSYPYGVPFGIQKYSRNSDYYWAGNQLTTSMVGMKINEPIAYGWSLVGAVEYAFNPYSLMAANGPRSLTDNNVNPLSRQTTNGDSSRAGAFSTAQMYVGVSSKTYGMLTLGRMNSLSYDLIAPYDPLNRANAFSLLGFSSSFPGFGDTETARINTAVRYQLQYQNFRAAGMAQVGGYGVGNPSNGFYQGQIGADFPDSFGGAFSLDGLVSWAKDAVSLANYAGANVAQFDHSGEYFIKLNNVYYDPNSIVKATLSNDFGVMLATKYKLDRFTFYGGYLYARLSNPTDSYPNGFDTIARGIFVPPGQVTSNAYNFNRINNTFWTGMKYSIWDNLDVAGGFYYQTQNDYNFTASKKGYTLAAACAGSSVNTSSSKCAGSQDGVGLLIDYRPVKRVDLYAGMMISNVYGGLASGFIHTQNINPGVGLRIKF
jgi:predicted porin